MENDDDINGEDGSMDIHRELLFAAQDLRTLTSRKAEITISRRLTIKVGAIKPSWDYLITFGDILNRGPWKWGCAQAETLEAALRRAEWARAADRWSMIAATDFLARSFTWPAPILATVRGLGLGAVQQLPPVKRLLARSFMFGWR